MSSSCAAYHTAVHFGFGCMFCTFQLTIVCITCSKKLTGSQLSLPHGIQQEMKPCVMGSHQPRRVATLLRTNEILQCWLSVKILATTYMVVHNMSPGQVFDLLTYTRTHADKHVENNIPAFAIADGIVVGACFAACIVRHRLTMVHQLTARYVNSNLVPPSVRHSHVAPLLIHCHLVVYVSACDFEYSP